MAMLLLLSLMAAVAAQNDELGHSHETGDRPEICEKKYVKPGSGFEISCESDSGVQIAIYPPKKVPSRTRLLEDSQALAGDKQPESTSVTKKWLNANKVEHAGWYTCVVHHGKDHDPLYSTGQCEVIIEDLCEKYPCPEHKICEPIYNTTRRDPECTCNYNCSTASGEMVCDNFCDFHWNECEMRKETCNDGKHREVILNEMCPAARGLPVVQPVIRRQDMDIQEIYGNIITLHSGLMESGSPPAQVYWSFQAEGETEFVDLESRDKQLEFEMGFGREGMYHGKVMTCMDESTAVTSVYRVTVAPPPTEKPTTDPGPGPILIPAYTCSIFPGGVISDFNSNSNFYDLACTHVLAANLMAGGTFYNPWFIYGTFDQEGGKTALMSMTFYLGRNIFEVQRGWVVHTGGNNKMHFEEGIGQTVGDSGCQVFFINWHISVYCEHFSAHYDGLMAGHIELVDQVGEAERSKANGEIGLCFDNESGRRPNWQVGWTTGRCEVDVEAPICSTAIPDSCFLAGIPELTEMKNMAWALCGVGATDACAELHCNGNQPTSSQQCSLEQANRVNCALKQGKSHAGQDASCPEEKCTWFERVLARGCPQEHPPFDCN